MQNLEGRGRKSRNVNCISKGQGRTKQVVFRKLFALKFLRLEGDREEDLAPCSGTHHSLRSRNVPGSQTGLPCVL